MTSTASTAAEAVAGGALACGGALVAVYYAQRNRRVDRSEARTDRISAAVTADSKIALEAWMALSRTNAGQIDQLTDRLDLMQKRVDECELVTVPALRETIRQQEDMLARLDVHQRAVADLSARTETLETEQHQRKTEEP